MSTTTTSVPRLRHALPLATALLVLAGCEGARPAATPPPTRNDAIAAPAPIPLAGSVATVAEHDGRVLVEFTLAKGKGLEPGSCFRVLAADGQRIKGMLQVTEVPSAGRGVARIIALTDRADPPAPGDQVSEITTLADPGAVTEQNARDQAGAQAKAGSDDEARFAALRSQYQRLLAEAVARHDADLAEARRACDARIAAAEEARAKDLAERERLHGAELAAARASAGEQALAAAAGERESAAKRAKDAVTERDNLRVQTDQLLAAQDELKRRIERLVAERSEADRSANARLRAEAEAREQLAARLASVERQAGGAASATAALLSHDPKRDEGILERLDRLSAEATVAADRAKRAEAAAAEAQEALLAARRKLSETEAARDAAESKVAAAGAVDAQLAKSAEDLRAARSELAAARERQSASDLARLEGERALFDLAARVLRLPKGGAEQTALQERLRATMAAQTATTPIDANAPERKP